MRSWRRLRGMDVGKFLRLQGAIESTIEGAKGKSSTQAGLAIEDAYVRLRQEVREAIPEEDREEFDRLFPASIDRVSRTLAQAPPRQVDRYGTAQTLLTTLSGWLGGYVQQARMQAEAKAYAEERVRAERGVGFQGGMPG